MRHIIAAHQRFQSIGAPRVLSIKAAVELLRIRQRRMGRRWRSAEEIDMHTKATIASVTMDIPLNKL